MNFIFKSFGKLIKYAAFILVFILLVYLILTVFNSAVTDYNVFKKGDHEVTVTKKTTQKSLFRKPIYLVKVDMNEHAAGGDNEILNRIPSWQFKRLKVGDQMNGHNIDNQHFFSTMDVIEDVFVMFLILLLLLFVLFSFIITVFSRVKWLNNLFHAPEKATNKKLNKHKKRKGRFRTWLESIFGEFTFTGPFLFCLFIILTILFNSFIVNTGHKIMPFGKTKATATVIDKESESAVLYYLQYNADPTFNLTLSYTGADGNLFETTKEVSKKLYDNVEAGSLVDITYRNRDGYDIFISDYNPFSVFYYWRYVELYIYVLYMLFVIFYFSFVIRGFKKRYFSKKV